MALLRIFNSDATVLLRNRHAGAIWWLRICHASAIAWLSIWHEVAKVALLVVPTLLSATSWMARLDWNWQPTGLISILLGCWLHFDVPSWRDNNLEPLQDVA